MKNFKAIPSILTFIILSCNHTPSKIVGNDNDKHGCKASAGYQWSVLKNECVRSFELPLQIFNKDSSYRTGVLFSTDSSQAEVFSVNGHFILDKNAAGKYQYNKDKTVAAVFLNNNGVWVWDYQH